MGIQVLRFYFLLLLANCLKPSQGCLDALRSQKLDCWSSCNLGNCGSVVEDPHEYVRCSWQWKEDNINTKINSTTIAYFYPSNQQSCEPSSHECNLTTGHCVDTYYLGNCTELGHRLNDVFTIWLLQDDVEVCGGIADIKVCMHVKPQPPIITNITITREKIFINTSAETCPPIPHMLFDLQYNWTKGNIIHSKIEKLQSVMSYNEAAQYNFSLRLTKKHYVFSDPVYGTLVTKPRTAVDRGEVWLSCWHGTNGTGKTKIAWQKHGIIDYFNVTLVDENNRTVLTSIVNSTSRSGNDYVITAPMIGQSEKNTLFITAFNEGGSSDTFRKDFDRRHCEELPKLGCSVISKGKSWIQVGWKTGRTISYPVEIDFANPYQPNKKIVNENIDSAQKRRNGTGLEQCVRYNISVCAGGKLVCCSRQEFTIGPG